MRRYIRLIVFVLGSAAGWAAGSYAPDLLDASAVKGLAAICGVSTLLLWHFFRQLNSATQSAALSAKEMGRFNLQMEEIRGKFWYAIFASYGAAAVLLLSASVAVHPSVQAWLPTLIGAITAYAAGLALSATSWLDQLARFGGALREREQRRKERDEVLKQLADGKKSSSA